MIDAPYDQLKELEDERDVSMSDSRRAPCVGFTGTRSGMTEKQRAAVIELLYQLAPTVVVHGDCIGADEDMHALAKAHGSEVYVRPCTFDSMRAHCKADRILAHPKPPMQRNRDIVADSDALIACPPNYERLKSGSGTWATIGFGLRAGIRVYIVFPDGSVRVENEPEQDGGKGDD